MSKKIEKKILPGYFRAVQNRQKTFEIRQDDADYQVGDVLVLREWNGADYTGRRCTREITYVLRNAPRFGLMDGYCILAIQPRGWNDPSQYAVLDGDSR